MGSLNRVQIIGNLGRDAELRYTPGGAAVATFSLACNETWTDKAGARQERTEWIRCVLWGKQAETLQEYLRKGKQVYAEGAMQTRKWDDKEGVTRYTTEVKVFKVVLLGGGRRDEAPHPAEETQSAPASGPDQQQPEPSEPLTEDDIPF